MCFFSITHPVYIQVFLRTLADVSVSDMFNSQLLPSCIFLSFIFHFILQWCPPGGAPRESPASPAAAPLPQIKYDEVEWKLKTPARGFYKPALVLSRLKNFVKVPGRTGFCVDTENAAVWASASSAFSVSFLAKFCTPWYLRSSELRQIQRRLYTFPFLEFICFKFPSPGILYPIFLLGNTVIRALPAADVPSSFGSL